jgi:mannose-1-phosphate guanylyltransferase/mannose-6-phosphate isomerase
MNKIIHPVILAGGSGTRLWPLSREKSPKQFIPLIDGKSLFQETCLRFTNAKLFAPITIITHEEHRFLVRDQLQKINISNATIITEPEAKNTLPACLSAAYFLETTNGNVPIIFTPADHVVSNTNNFFHNVTESLPFILNGSIGLFGIKPATPHTGYGYIIKDKKLNNSIYKPFLFIEKPNKEKAAALIQQGALWNSGIYFSTSQTLIHEAGTYEPEISTIIKKLSPTLKKNDYGFYMIPKNIYDLIPATSIDKSITEKTDKLILAETAVSWNDLGSWKSLHDHFKKNDDGNILRGDIISIETNNSYIESTHRLVTTIGIENTGVIETPDAVLVFPLHRSESVKDVVSKLREQKRSEVDVHMTVQKPWGEYQVLADEKHFKAKKLTVYPGSGGLSIQRHRRRSEHWIVVSGIATVMLDENIFELQKNESVFIPMGSKHRLLNNHADTLVLVEVQTGDYFGEDDIERFDDIYGRV